MIDTLGAFVDELRAVGAPVSMVEAIDAGRALAVSDLADRTAFRETLAATLIKHRRHRRAFDLAFDVFFGLTGSDGGAAGANGAAEGVHGSSDVQGTTAGGGGGDDAMDLVERLLSAMQAQDRDELLAVARDAVSRLAGMEPGRPVGGRYYLYRVLRRLDIDSLRERLLAAIAAADGEDLEGRLAAREVDGRIEDFRSHVRREIVRRLVADRGAEAVAKTLRRPLVEDIDLMHATKEELVDIERQVQALARKLASRLAQLRKHGRRGRLDVRRTIRRSLSHGGVLLEPKFRPPRRTKPELVMVCDVSGSMATFARFTMQLVYAVGHQFSKVKAYAFIDALDEVTEFFGPGADFHDALTRIGTEAKLVWRDGHSDYGHALQQLWREHGDAITPRSTVLVTGDARNNYREPGTEFLEAVATEARAVLWLNPEPRRYWNTGDSIMSTYDRFCASVHEVRTLRQLEAFVEGLVMLPPSVRLAAGR